MSSACLMSYCKDIRITGDYELLIIRRCISYIGFYHQWLISIKSKSNVSNVCLCAGVGDTLQKRKSSGDGGNSHVSYWDSPPCEHITFPQFSQALDRSIIFTQITVYMSWLTLPLVPGIFSQTIPPHSHLLRVCAVCLSALAFSVCRAHGASAIQGS